MEPPDPYATFDRRISHCRLTYAHTEQEARTNLQTWLDEQHARYPVVEIPPFLLNRPAEIAEIP